MKFFVVFLIASAFFLAAESINPYPIATLTCRFCNAGNPLSYELLPAGSTCTDLDAALRNLGDTNGCLGMGSSANTTSSQPTAAQVAALNAQIAQQKGKIRMLTYSMIGVTLLLGLAVVGLSIYIYITYQREKRVVYTNDSRRLANGLNHNLY